MDCVLNNILEYISVIMLKLNVLEIHAVHTIHFTAWLKPWIMFTKAIFVFSKGYSAESLFYRIITNVM